MQTNQDTRSDGRASMLLLYLVDRSCISITSEACSGASDRVSGETHEKKDFEAQACPSFPMYPSRPNDVPAPYLRTSQSRHFLALAPLEKLPLVPWAKHEYCTVQAKRETKQLP